MTKKEFRGILMSRISALDAEYIRSSDRGLFENFVSLEEYERAKTIFAYISCGREPDTVEILNRALADGKTVALPESLPGGIMKARRINSLSELVPGRFGIPAPPEGAEEIAPEDVDLIIVPAVTFDECGRRMGRGGGYYDRYLAASPAFSVGLAREELLTSVPTEEHDMAVACLVTEKTVRRFADPSGRE